MAASEKAKGKMRGGMFEKAEKESGAALVARAATPRRRKTDAPAGEAAETIVTTFRIRRDQWDALRLAAMNRAMGKTGGRDAPRRPDASEIVRDAVDEWLAKHR